MYDSIIQSPGDMIEWSVEACLHAATKHDTMVIEEALSVDECTEMLNQSKVDHQGDISVLH